MDLCDLEKTILAVLDDLVPYAPKIDFDTVRDLVVCGEPRIAVEIICDQLYEYDTKVSAEIVARLRSVCKTMNLDEANWRDLSMEN